MRRVLGREAAEVHASVPCFHGTENGDHIDEGEEGERDHEHVLHRPERVVLHGDVATTRQRHHEARAHEARAQRAYAERDPPEHAPVVPEGLGEDAAAVQSVRERRGRAQDAEEQDARCLPPKPAIQERQQQRHHEAAAADREHAPRRVVGARRGREEGDGEAALEQVPEEAKQHTMQR